MEDFICPITLEKLKYPIVLLCGHTFEKECIVQLKKSICPLCQKFFDKKIALSCPNWIVIQHLNLEIDMDEKEKMELYSIQDAKKEMMRVEDDNYLLNHVLRVIKRKAKCGYSECVYTYNTYFVTPRKIFSLKYKLGRRGFLTQSLVGCLWQGYLYISWNF